MDTSWLTLAAYIRRYCNPNGIRPKDRHRNTPAQAGISQRTSKTRYPDRIRSVPSRAQRYPSPRQAPRAAGVSPPWIRESRLRGQFRTDSHTFVRG